MSVPPPPYHGPGGHANPNMHGGVYTTRDAYNGSGGHTNPAMRGEHTRDPVYQTQPHHHHSHPHHASNTTQSRYASGGAVVVSPSSPPVVIQTQPAPPDYIILSCVVFWCCNCPFGAIAIALSMASQSSAREGYIDEARSLGQGAFGVNVAGIVVTVIILVIVIVVATT